MTTPEQPLMIDGGGHAMVGVYTPAAGGAASVACLLFNAGVLQRIGPRRLNVRLARELAARGIAALRLDLSGLGDSPVAPQPRGYLEQGIADLRAAMNQLERDHGVRRFLLFGICSGAALAFWSAAADERIAGILMFDGYWYRTRWTEPVRLWKRFAALGWRGLREALARRAQRRRGDAGADGPVPPAAVDGGVVESNPPQAEFARELQKLVDRGVAVQLLYGGSVSRYVSYQRQFADAFRGHAFVDRVRCELRPDIDHTVISRAAQARLSALVCRWALDACRPPR